MKVAFLAGSTHRIPRLGGEARVYHMARFLASRGIEVDLFGSRFGEDLMTSNMSQFQSFKTWSGGDWYPISMGSVPTFVRSTPALIHQSQRLRSYNVIITELGSAWQALCCKQIDRLPIVLDEHNVEWYLMRQEEISVGKPRPWSSLRVYERICHNAFDHVLVVSATDKAVFEADGTPAEKMLIVPNGVDINIFRPDAELGQKVRNGFGLDQDDSLVMYMGSLKFFPNVDAVSSILKTVYPKAKDAVPNLRLMITGPGSGDLSTSASDRIILTGVVDRAALPSYINAADVCIAPLRFGSGTRFKLLEWMACGKAVIATRKAAEGLEVTHEKNILLEDSLEEYPALISKLCRDQSLRESLGQNARFFVEKTHAWEKCMAPLEVLLRNI